MKTIYIIHSRLEYYPQTTIGNLRIDGVQFCYTLEDTVRPVGIKVKKHTAIPEHPVSGYKVSITYSQSRKRKMLCLHTEEDGVTIKHGNVKFTYCYAHGGNKHEDTEGCVLVAYKREGNTIQGTAERELFDLVSNYIKDGYEVKWIIKNECQNE